MMLLRVEDETDEALIDLKRTCEGLLNEHTAHKARLDQSTAPRSRCLLMPMEAVR
jgi:hypothetical protein